MTVPTQPEDGQHPEHWRIDNPVGLVDADRAASTTAAPMLAGFCFASAVVLLTAENKPMWTEPALTGFFLAAAALLFAVQFGNAGLMYSAPPSERLAWLPDPGNIAHVNLAKRVQDRDSAVAARYRRRARACYDTGVVLLMVALTAASVPAEWNAWRVVLVALLAGGGGSGAALDHWRPHTLAGPMAAARLQVRRPTTACGSSPGGREAPGDGTRLHHVAGQALLRLTGTEVTASLRTRCASSHAPLMCGSPRLQWLSSGLALHTELMARAVAFAVGEALPLLVFALAGRRGLGAVHTFRKHMRKVRIAGG